MFNLSWSESLIGQPLSKNCSRSYTIVRRSEQLKTKRKIIKTPWGDVSKGGIVKTDYRSRLVGKFKTYADDTLCAPTPPLAALG